MPSWINAAKDAVGGRLDYAVSEAKKVEEGTKAGTHPVIAGIGGPVSATVRAPAAAANASKAGRLSSLSGIAKTGAKATSAGKKAKKGTDAGRKAASLSGVIGKTASGAKKGRRLSSLSGIAKTGAKATTRNVDAAPRLASLVGPASGNDPVSESFELEGLNIEDGTLSLDTDAEIVPGLGNIAQAVTFGVFAIIALGVIYVLGQLFNINIG